jgi:multidrug resistance efflux pump
MKKTLYRVLILAAIAGVGSHWALRGESGQPEQHEQKAVLGRLDEVVANGVVEGARPEVALRPEIAGMIAVVHARENQKVSRGDILVELHNESQKQQVAIAAAEVAAAKAQLERLQNGERPEKRRAAAALEKSREAMYEQARADDLRTRGLADKRSSSLEQYESHHFKMLRARAEWQAAQAERELIEAPARQDEVAVAQAHLDAMRARLRLAEAELAKTRLTAPSSGSILQVYAEPGELAGPTSSQPILLLADLSKHRVRAFVEELDAADVQLGQHALVTADGQPGKEFTGRVTVVVPRMGKRAPQSDVPGEYKDVYFREVLLDLDAGNDLPLNLRVLVHITLNR